jgi:UDP-2,3-diacylglucosamine pyrophosphatase LpxH
MKNSDIQVKEDHLCVISDLHLGNPAFKKKDYLRSFLHYFSKKGASLCINGDGFDLLQFSTSKLANDLQSAIISLKDFLSQGRKKLYYVNGNHDIHSEQYLSKSGICSVIPFLQLVSGDRQIHIEHGHIYDQRFRRFPRLYIHLSKVLGKLVKVSPKFFHLFFKIEWLLAELKKKSHGLEGTLFDSPSNLAAALGFFTRGFDIVILAHTHRHGLHIIDDGKILANAGAWTSDKIHYLEIQEGAIHLKEWSCEGKIGTLRPSEERGSIA